MKKLWSIIFVILVVLTVVLKVIIYSKEKQELANLRQSAEQGNAEAQYSLGLMYSSGDGIPKDKVEAAKWYLKAAEQGDASAQMNLGYLYSSGDGIPKDETEGEKWYRKSAEQGNANAQYSLGLMYWSELREFLDIPKDDTEAAGQLKTLQAAALASLKEYTERANETFRLAPVLEASVTNEVVDAFPWLRGCAQQGGLLFELKSEPATLQCQVEETAHMQGGYA